MPRHKIYKYASRWYFTCEWCSAVESLPTWTTAFYIGREHIDFKHRDLLTAPLQL